MGFLSSKPSSVVRGGSQELNLSAGAQTSIAGMITDAYLSDKANWKRVIFYYTTGLQKVAVVFNVSTNKGYFKTSSKAIAGTWQLAKIEVDDFDGGQVVIMRSSITNASDDDLSVTSA